MAESTEYSEVPNKDESKDGANSPKSGQLVKGDASDVVCLKAKMSLLNGITVIVGSIIGSGIFVSPKGVLSNTGSVGLSLTVWITSGIFSMIGAYCYAELGCMITKTGADYAYIMESFGPFMAFLRLWIECMIVRPCSQAIVALTFSFYALRPIFPDCDPPDDAVRYLACICIEKVCWSSTALPMTSQYAIYSVNDKKSICIRSVYYIKIGEDNGTPIAIKATKAVKPTEPVEHW